MPKNKTLQKQNDSKNDGYIEKDGKDIDAWCIKFDKKIVTYVKSRRKGHKEDFDFEELQAAIELYKEHEEEDK